MRASGKLSGVLLAGCMLLVSATSDGQVVYREPQPGDIYREIPVKLFGEDWRVTYPLINTTAFPDASNFLPNPQVTFTIPDLTGAVRAEIVIPLYAGHIGTWKKKVRFNGNAWINIPELDQSNGIPAGSQGYWYLYQTMVTIDVPLAHVQTGQNWFQGENEGQEDKYSFLVGQGGWGQHGWAGVLIRVYYDNTVPHPTGQITSPASSGSFTDNPLITADVSPGVTRVDFLASYEGVDTDGDGIYTGYHNDYHVQNNAPSIVLKNAAGSATGAPFQATWSTAWVPDQPAGSIKLLARIQDGNGVWYVTPEVTNLSLRRTGASVRLYKAYDVAERMWSQGANTPIIRSKLDIPAAHRLTDAVDARLHLRTWNGVDGGAAPGHYYSLNTSWYASNIGRNHDFSEDLPTIPTGALRSGQNDFEAYGRAQDAGGGWHHGIEVLWPGPSLMVRYNGSYDSPVPAVAQLVSPVNGETSAPLSVNLRWRPAAAADSYRLQVATDSLFSAVVLDDSTITDTVRLVGPLSSQTTFYWRVRAKNTAGTGVYTAVWNFRTFVAAPGLIAPPNNTTGVATTLQLRWGRVSGATAYRLQVGTDSTFAGSLVVHDSTLTDTTRTVLGLAYGAKYFWRVSATVGGGSSGYSSIWSFTTSLAPAGTPALLAPVNGLTGVPVSAFLLWRSATSTDSYRLQVGTDSTFASGVAFDDSTITDTSRTATGLAHLTRYFWRVRAKGPGGSGAFSPVWNFTTILAPPAAVQPVSPADGAVNQPVAGLRFTWRSAAGTDFYRFQLGTDSTFASGLVKNDSSVTDTFRIVSGLNAATRHFWRLNARNAGGNGQFSPVYVFTTVTPMPGQVLLDSPPDGTVLNADSGTFSWLLPSPPGSFYWFEISVDSSFSMFRVVDSTVTDTAIVFGPLVNGQRYFWRVRSGSPGSWGPFSETRSFRVIITDVADRDNIPTAFELSQNYPNPFNPSTRIEISLPVAAPVRLEVFSLLGVRVAIVLDAPLPAGRHTIGFDAAGLPSGSYLLRMTTPQTSLVRKMTLIK